MAERIESCEKCEKPVALCVCSSIHPVRTKLEVLILQHPQEKQEDLATARLAQLTLEGSMLRTGLSWPNLKAALKKEAQPSRWAVLYLGSGIKSEGNPRPVPGLYFVDKKSNPVARPESLEGLVVLDGTWSQAKTLWWRNAWLLKLRRAILVPANPSLYGSLRREPRKECLSTIESLGEALTALGESPEVEIQLRNIFKSLLEKRAKKS